MNLPDPQEFTELIGTAAFFCVVAFAFISLREKGRENALRLTGITAIVCLSLFAKNAYVYFAAVFIIATGITSIEFLENLAAIIRDSKAYFDFKGKNIQQQPATTNTPATKSELANIQSTAKAELSSDLRADLHQDGGLSFILSGQAEKAIQVADELLVSNPNDAQALRVRAEACEMLNRLDEAVQGASRALEIEPNNAFALRTRAEACRRLNRLDEAVRDASQALQIEPNNAFALRTKAEACRGLKRFDEAIRDASQVLQIEPNNAFALRTRAEACRALERFDEAIRDASQALQIEPNNAFALGTRAASYLRLGQVEEAIRDASRALQVQPDYAFGIELLKSIKKGKKS